MITQIARKEFTETMRDGRFRWAAVIVLGLLVVSLLVGWKHYAETDQQRDFAKQQERERWLGQGQKNPHSAAHYGVYAFKPELPLSAVDRGLNPYLGVTVWLEAHKQNEFKFRPAEDATAVQRFGELTAAATLQIIIPLLIILLLYSTFSGEREQGTLRMLMSLGIPKRGLAFGKALGAIAVLGALLVPATLIGVAAMILFAGPSDMASSAGRMLVMVASYLLYFGIFIGIALIVSAKAKSSQLALVILLTSWFINSFVAPRLASDIAKGLYPTPSAVELATAIERDTEQGIDGHLSRGERLEELKRQAVRQYNVKSVEELPVNFSGIQLNEADEYGYKVYDKHFGALFDTYERQNTAYQIGAAAAPMLGVQSISMGLSGTDYAQHRAFAVAAEMYRRDIQKRMSDALTNNSRTGAYYVAGDELWKEVPSFSYASPGLGWVLSNHRWSLLLLMWWFVLVCIATPAAVSRIRLD